MGYKKYNPKEANLGGKEVMYSKAPLGRYGGDPVQDRLDRQLNIADQADEYGLDRNGRLQVAWSLL